jgi:hypothetical protein
MRFHAMFSAATVLSVAACDKTKEPPASEPVGLSRSEVTLHVGEIEQLTVTGGTGEETFVWSSDNGYAVSAGGDGRILAHKVGSATVTVKAGNEQAQCRVSVEPRHTLFAEPYIKWGATQAEVKQALASVLGSPTSESADNLRWELTGPFPAYAFLSPVVFYEYDFMRLSLIPEEDKGLYRVSLDVNIPASFPLYGFMDERYLFISVQSGKLVFADADPVDKATVVVTCDSHGVAPTELHTNTITYWYPALYTP